MELGFLLSLLISVALCLMGPVFHSPQREELASHALVSVTYVYCVFSYVCMYIQHERLCICIFFTCGSSHMCSNTIYLYLYCHSVMQLHTVVIIPHSLHRICYVL